MGIDFLGEIVTGPIKEKTGINADETMLLAGDFLNSPNRHQILHGKITNYPSEVNSLKIISFVGWMGGDICEAIERAKIETE